MFKKKKNRGKTDQLEKAEIIDLLERLNGNVEEIWHKLDIVGYHIQEITECGFSKDVEEAIIYLARAHSKEYDEKWKKLEDAVVGTV